MTINDEFAKELHTTIWDLLFNNGGPTSTLEGTDTHVLVRRTDFGKLDENEKKLRQLLKQ